MNVKQLCCDCGCNGSHGQAIKTLPALANLTDIVPSGLKALVLCDCPVLKKEAAKLYRIQSPDICGEGLTSDGNTYGINANGNTYGINANEDRAGASAFGTHCGVRGRLVYRDFAAAFELLQSHEDVRIVISEGDYVPFGKYVAARLDITHAAVGGGNLSRFELVQTSGFAAKKLQKTVAVADFERVDLPGGFAFIMGAAVALFDWDVSALLFGQTSGQGYAQENNQPSGQISGPEGQGYGAMCGEVFKSAQKIISRVLDAAKLFSRRSPQLKKELFQAQIDMAALINARGGELLLSGATQSAAALSMLFAHEERDTPDIFSTAFLLSPLVAKAYAAFLDKGIPFAFPPDNNLRASRLSEYLGLPQHEAYPRLPAHMDIKKLRLADYRLSVYRSQLQSQIYGIIRILEEAQPLFLRLYQDDGYALKGLFGCLDSSLALGLGSDVLPADTLLSYMRAKGVLDRFIL